MIAKVSLPVGDLMPRHAIYALGAQNPAKNVSVRGLAGYHCLATVASQG